MFSIFFKIILLINALFFSLINCGSKQFFYSLGEHGHAPGSGTGAENGGMGRFVQDLSHHQVIKDQEAENSYRREMAKTKKENEEREKNQKGSSSSNNRHQSSRKQFRYNEDGN